MTATESAIHPMFNVWSTQCLNHLSKRLRTVNKAFVDISNCWPGVLHLYNLTCVCQCGNQNNLVGQKSLTRFLFGWVGGCLWGNWACVHSPVSHKHTPMCTTQTQTQTQTHNNVYNTNTPHTLIGPFPACSWLKGTDGFVWNVEEKWITMWMTDGPEQPMHKL